MIRNDGDTSDGGDCIVLKDAVGMIRPEMVSPMGVHKMHCGAVFAWADKNMA